MRGLTFGGYTGFSRLHGVAGRGANESRLGGRQFHIEQVNAASQDQHQVHRFVESHTPWSSLHARQVVPSIVSGLVMGSWQSRQRVGGLGVTAGLGGSLPCQVTHAEHQSFIGTFPTFQPFEL
jgi:hypothetical protein